MNSRAWSQNLASWLPAAIFCGVMLALLSLFALRYADEAEVARGRLERRTEQLDAVRANRQAAEEVMERIRASEAGLAEFYGRRLSSESEALTRVLAEVKELSARAGIPPGGITYERERLVGQDVSRRSIRFAVNGSYQQLRQLVNFLELSDSFLILEGVALSGSDLEGTPLRISLTLSTLFTTGPDAGPMPAQESAS